MKQVMSPREALRKLMNGNKRFSSGLRSVEAMASVYNRQELALMGQRPFAMVLTCSDSRAPVEIVFDQGLGDLFVIRVAGNVAATSVVASIEYAFLNLGTSLCLVMGHTGCGAVRSMLDRHLHFAKAPTPNIQLLIDEISPSLQKRKKKDLLKMDMEDLSDEITLVNVNHTLQRIREMSPVVRKMEKGKKIMMMGAVYDINSGKVTLNRVEKKYGVVAKK